MTSSRSRTSRGESSAARMTVPSDGGQEVIQPTLRYGRADSAVERGRRALQSRDVREAYVQVPAPKGAPLSYAPHPDVVRFSGRGTGGCYAQEPFEWAVVTDPEENAADGV